VPEGEEGSLATRRGESRSAEVPGQDVVETINLSVADLGRWEETSMKLTG